MPMQTIIGKTTLRLVTGDIADQDTDAVVTAAHWRLNKGTGTDGTIHTKGGPQIYEECRRIGGCPIGDAVITHRIRYEGAADRNGRGPVVEEELRQVGVREDEQLGADDVVAELAAAAQEQVAVLDDQVLEEPGAPGGVVDQDVRQQQVGDQLGLARVRRVAGGVDGLQDGDHVGAEECPVVGTDGVKIDGTDVAEPPPVQAETVTASRTAPAAERPAVSHAPLAVTAGIRHIFMNPPRMHVR